MGGARHYGAELVGPRLDRGGGARQGCSFPAGEGGVEPGVDPELMDSSVTIQIPALGIHLVTLKSEPFVCSDCCCDLLGLLWEL